MVFDKSAHSSTLEDGNHEGMGHATLEKVDMPAEELCSEAVAKILASLKHDKLSINEELLEAAASAAAATASSSSPGGEYVDESHLHSAVQQQTQLVEEIEALLSIDLVNVDNGLDQSEFDLLDGNTSSRLHDLESGVFAETVLNVQHSPDITEMRVQVYAGPHWTDGMY